MAGPPAAMELESSYLQALEQADGYQISGGSSLILTLGETTLARLIRS